MGVQVPQGPEDIDRLQETAFAEVAERITALYREAQETEAQLDAVLATVPAIIWRWDRAARCTFVNDAWTAVLGRDPTEALGSGWAGSVHPDDVQVFQERCVRAMEEGMPFAAEYRLRRADGTYVTVNDQGRPMAGDPVNGYVGAALDVSAQREAETRERASNALFSAIAVGMGMALGVKDLAGRYILVNEVMARILGASVEDVLGHTDRDLGSPGWEGFVAEDRRIIASGEPLRAERHVLMGDTARSYLAHKSPLRRQDGKIEGIIIVTADVTPEHLRRQRAERLERLARMLAGARRVGEVADVALGEALEALQAPHGALGLPSPDGRALVLERERGYAVKRDAWAHVELDATTPVASAFTTGAPLFFDDAAALLAAFPDLRGQMFPYEACAALPLLGREGPIGVLYAAFDEARTFDAETITFCISVADLVARSLERATLFEAAEDAAAETAVLLRITADLGGAVTMRDVTRVATVSARDAVHADGCLVGLVDPDARIIRYQTDAYPPALIPLLPTSLEPGHSPAGDAVVSGTALAFATSEELLSAYPRLQDLLEQLPFESRLFTPIVGSGEPIGVMVASSRTPGRFGPDDVRLLQAIGRQCGQALERATFYRDARSAVARAAALRSATLSLAATFTTEAASDAIMAEGLGLLDATLGGLAVLDRDASVLRPVRWSGIPEELVQGLTDIPLDADTAGTDAVRSQRPAYLSLADMQAADPDGAARAKELGIGSLAVLPLVSGGTVVGVVGLGFPAEAAPAPEDQALLEAFAERAAATLQRTHLLESERQARRELEGALSRLSRLQSVTTALSLAVRVDEVARVVLDATSNALGGTGGSTFVSDGKVLRRIATLGEGETGYAETLTVDARISVCEAFRTGNVVWVPSHEEWVGRYPDGAAPFAGRALSVIAIPFVLEDRVLGSMAVVFDKERSLTRAERRLARTIGQQAAQAIERARLYEAERHRSLQVERLQRVATELAVSAMPEEIAHVLVSTGVEAVGAQAGIVLIEDDEGAITIIGASGFPETLLAPIRTTSSDAPLPGNDVIRSRLPSFLRSPEEIAARYPDHDPSGPNLAEAAWATLPLLVQGTAIGAVHLSFATPQSFSAEQVGELAMMVGEAAKAMARARSSEREREASLVLQESLLPRDLIVAWNGAEVATRYRAGAEHLEVGGDWYDVIELPNGRLGVSIGDVVGRGLHAAAAMGQLRSALRAIALDCGGPAATLEGLDRFATASPGTELATVVYGELDPASGEFCYACAGHPPPVARIDGVTEVLDAGRSPLLAAGFLGPRTESVRTLPPGSTVVLYTDGLVERRGETFDRGIDRLVDAMGAADGGDLDDLCDALSLRLLEGPQRDDVAFLCLRVGEPGSVFSTTFPAEPSALRDLRLGLRDWLEARSVDPVDIESSVLAVNEAAANSIEHGYRDGGAGPVDIQARLDDGALVVAVRDRGRWRDDPPEPSRGRGIAMMQMLMDAVEVQHGTLGTSVRLRRRVQHGVPDAP